MSKRKTGGILGALGCFIIFCCVFFHDDDPYFVFDTMLDFVVSFSQLSSSFGKVMKAVMLKGGEFSDAVRKAVDAVFTYDYLSVDSFISFIAGKIQSFIDGGSWDIWGSMF